MTNNDNTSTHTNGIRLAKVLAQCGVASRRQAEVFIQQGRVSVNGMTIKEVATFVLPDNDRISVDGALIQQPERLRIWRYYKPAGVITTHRDPEGRPTVFDAAKAKNLPHVVSVGRLDLNSEGLILLTNQGKFAHYAEHPKTAWKRCYRVRVFGELPTKALMDLKKGITIDGMHYEGIDVDIDLKQHGNGRNTWLTVTLTEGKNREIRRVMNHLGLSVNRLIRLSYGPFALEQLNPGEIKEVPRSHISFEL